MASNLDPQGRAWRPTQATPSHASKAASNRGKVFAILVVMLALGGAIAGWLLTLRPFHEPAFLAIPVTEDSRHYPPNAFAEQDTEAILRHFPHHSKMAFQSQEKERLLKELMTLTTGAGSAVVVYLSAHAVVRDGQVYLLPGDTDPDSPNTWIPLTRVLKDFGEARREQKLLILDIMRPLAEPRLGVLADDVPRQVKDTLDKEKPDFSVLCACSAGEVSLVSEELERSVFGYYIAEALLGRADGYNRDGKRDGRVSVLELAEFVSSRVDRWAVRNRDVHQTPYLAGQGNDFPLVALAGNAAPTETGEEPPEPVYPKWLLDRWELRDRWEQADAFRLVPLAFRQLEGTLLRAEQRWQAGIKSGRIEEDLAKEIADFEKQYQQAKLPAGPKAHTLAVAALGLKLDAADRDALRDLLAPFDKLPPPQPKELEEPKKKFLDRFKEKSYLQLAATVHEVMTDDANPSRDKILLVLQLLQELKKPAVAYAEIVYLERLADLKVMEGSKWPLDTVARGLRVVREAQRTCTADPQAFSSVQVLLRAAERKRLMADGLLFSSSIADDAKTGIEFEEAEKLYQAANEALRTLSNAYRTYERARVLLPGFVPYLVSRQQLETREDKLWTTTVQAVQLLGKTLAALTAEGSPPVDELRRQTADVNRLLAELSRPFSNASLTALIGHANKGGVGDYLEIQTLLQSPRLRAKDRSSLWLASRQLARRLNSAIIELDGADSLKGAPPRSTSLSPLQKTATEQERAERRSRLAVDLLNLGGVAEADKWERDWIQAKSGNSLAAWQGLGDKIRLALAKQVPKQFQDNLTRNELAAAARLTAVFYPFDRDSHGKPGELGRNPAALLRRQETREFWKWLGDRFRSEGQLVRTNHAGFYADVAEDYFQNMRLIQ